MRLSIVAKSLLVLGALVGGLAGLALAFNLRLDQLPPWMITVGLYKLAFIAAAGLFVAGATLGRAARGRSSPEEASHSDGTVRRQTVGPGPWQADRRLPEGSARHPDPVAARGAPHRFRRPREES